MWIIGYIVTGLIYYFLWLNDVFDNIIGLFEHELLGIMAVIFIMNIMVFMTVSLCKKT